MRYPLWKASTPLGYGLSNVTRRAGLSYPAGR